MRASCTRGGAGAAVRHTLTTGRLRRVFIWPTLPSRATVMEQTSQHSAVSQAEERAATIKVKIVIEFIMALPLGAPPDVQLFLSLSAELQAHLLSCNKSARVAPSPLSS